MVKIVLYSSQLAAFIGRNIHTNTSRIFNKLFEKFYPSILTNLKLIDKVKQENLGDGASIDKLCSKLEHNKDLRSKLDNLCKQNFSSFTMKKETETLVKNVLEKEKLSNEDQLLLQKITDSYTNKKYGTVKEVNAIDVYKERMKVDVVTGIGSRSKKLLEIDGNELWIISKINAMKMDGTVIEIKNRMYKLFEEVREYEWLQVQTYLEVYNLEGAELVEYLKVGDGEMRVNQINRDRKYWNEIVYRDLNLYFSSFINLINNEKKLKKYFTLTESEQNEMIKRMVRKEEKK